MDIHERQFLLAVERGEVEIVRNLLERRDQLNLDINCTDPLARNALIIAIDNENLEIIKLLLKANIEIGDGLLYAIDESFVEAVELLLEHQSNPIQERQWSEESFYSAEMSPLILAAHRNNLEIIKILLDRKVEPIKEPHDPQCDCSSCCRARKVDCLRHSQARINAYRALVSPCLMALSSADPLLAAFKRSEKLENLATLEPEYREDYLKLRAQCQKFATLLMDHTRTSKELEILLNYSEDLPEVVSSTSLMAPANEIDESYIALEPIVEEEHDEDEPRWPALEAEGRQLSNGILGVDSASSFNRAPSPGWRGRAGQMNAHNNSLTSNLTELSSMNEFMETDTYRRRRQRLVAALRNDSKSRQKSASTSIGQRSMEDQSTSNNQELDQRSKRLARLKLAIQCKQKTFCAHPNIQELLANMWYENLPGFRRMSFLSQFVQVISIGIMFPIYSSAYLMAPNSKLGSYIKKPFIKFICHSASYITFLLVLILASQRVEAFYSWSSVINLLSTLTLSQHKQQAGGASSGDTNFTVLWKQVSKHEEHSLHSSVPANIDNLDVETLALLYKKLGESTATSARSLDSLSKMFGELPASSKKRGTLPSPIETIIIVWVVSLIWAEIKQIKQLGINYYKHDMWNILDSVASGFYIGAVILRAISYFHADERTIEVAREHWNAYDPTLLSEGLFATATIFSALKLVYIFSLNPYLGPLQISLGRMIIDILRFSWIYLLVLFAFACGMNQLLWYYADLERHQCLNATNYSLAQYYSGLKLQAISASTNSSAMQQALANQTTPIVTETEAILPNINDEKLVDSLDDDSSSKPPVTIDDSCKTWRHFSNVFESVQTLFWANFGLVDLENFELTGIRQYTRFWALLMFGCYCFINVIVVLNLLIAMMNHSYVKISQRSDVEWKFARTRLWMSYFDSGSTVPAPFNIIPSLKFIRYLFGWVFKICCPRQCSEQECCEKINSQRAKLNSLRQSYREVVRSLVRRYLVHEQRILEKKRALTEAKLNRWAKWSHNKGR